MKEKNTSIVKTDAGVVVGRFQVHKLTEAHKDLINTVRSNHNKLIILLGLSPAIGTTNNPLDYETRKRMIQVLYPEAIIQYIKDTPNDAVWSKQLDEQIRNVLSPMQSAMLYGGRDSFIDHYNGSFPVTEFEPKVVISGTELRKEISSKVKESEDFRAGVIWAVYNQFPKVIATVDVIIYDERNRLLLVRKHKENLYRFVGGFCQPDSESNEYDARREVMEETGVEIGMLEYVGNMNIADWRYIKEVDKIRTTIFKAKYIYGSIVIKDEKEIKDAKWFERNQITENDVVPEHRPILALICNR